MIYLDNAATTYPKPPGVLAAVTEAMTAFGANPGRGGYAMAERTGDMVYSVRERAARFFGLRDPSRVVFTPGCTWAINCVLKGTLVPGDHVIISDLEHNAVVRPLHELERRGVRVSRAHVAECDPDATVRAFAALVEPRTKMIFCTHASNVFGVKLPVERLARLCGERGILFGVDCAQTAGTARLDFDSCPCDFMCVPAHKGLYGLTGCGLLLCGGSAAPRPLCEGGTGSLSAVRDMPEELPDRLEAGTLCVPGIAALGAGIAAVERAGRERLEAHELALMRQLHRELSRMANVSLYTQPPRGETHVPLLSFNIGALPSERAAELLGGRGIAVRAGYHCAFDAHAAFGTRQRGTVRVCPSMFTTADDIDALLRAVYEISKNA